MILPRRRRSPERLAEERSAKIRAVDDAAGRVHELRASGRSDGRAERDLLRATREFLRINSRAVAAGAPPLIDARHVPATRHIAMRS